MTNATKQRLREAFHRALDLSPDTTCDDLEYSREPRWDSVGHLQLILEIEREFGVTIGNDEVLQLTSFQNILAMLDRLGA